MAIDLMRLTPAQLEKVLHMDSIIAGQKAAAARVVLLRDYYDGEQPVFLSDRQKEYLEPALRNRKSGAELKGVSASLTEGEYTFTHNTVKSVIDTLRERLSVSGFTVNGAGLDAEDSGANPNSPEAKLASRLWSWWEENRFDAQQIRLHRRVIRDGLSYVMVDYDSENQRPRFTLHPVDDGVTGITCHRDPENPDIILYMCKHWYTYNPLTPGETGTRRKTVYMPDQIRKYIMGKDGFWQPTSDAGDTSWPIAWVDRDGKPLGITLREFENPGGSEVAQIIGLQNALNKSWLDLLAAADAAGFPILALEYELNPQFPNDNATDDDDIDGTDEFFMAPGRALTIEGGKAHRIEIADLSQLINTIHLVVETIAGISRTPQYYLRPVGGSDVPSGEALKQLESGLVSRAKERQLIFGQAWADVMNLAYKIERTFGNTSLPEVPRLKVQTVWDSPETRNDLLEAQRAQILKALDVPDDFILPELGFSPKDIRKMQASKRSDQAANTAAVVEAVQKAQASQQAAQNSKPTTVVNNVSTNGNGKVGA